MGCAAVSYSTIQYPKIDFWRAEFFSGRIYDTIPTYGENLSTYMKYCSIFTVHTRDGRDGTGRTDGRQFNLLILVRKSGYKVDTYVRSMLARPSWCVGPPTKRSVRPEDGHRSKNKSEIGLHHGIFVFRHLGEMLNTLL